MRKVLLLRNEIAEIAHLPLFVEEIGREMSLPEGTVFNLNLVLEEALSNIIQYGYAPEEKGQIAVEAICEYGRIILTLTDSGIAFDPTSIPEADTSLPLDKRPVGGLGFFIVRQLMDEVEYVRKDGKNILTLTKIIGKAEV